MLKPQNNPIGPLADTHSGGSTRCATPFIAARDGRASAYRLAGIRRRGLDEADPRYWFTEFNPKSGLGIVVDRPSRLSLQRGLVGPDAPLQQKGGLHFVRLVREDGQVYWEGYCVRAELELELAFVKIEGEHEIPVDLDAASDSAGWQAVRVGLIAAIVAAVIVYGSIYLML